LQHFEKPSYFEASGKQNETDSVVERSDAMIAKEVVGGSCFYCYPKSNFTDFVTFSVVSTKNKKVPKMSALFEKAHLDHCPSSGMIGLS